LGEIIGHKFVNAERDLTLKGLTSETC
jgi:hypothetical protein